MRVVLVAAFLASTVVARPIRIAATGDSYTWGRKCNGDPYTNSYPVRMQQILKEEYGYETNVSNAGLFNVAFEYALNPAIKQYAVRYCEEGQGYCGKSGDLHYPDMIKEVSADADVMLIMMGTNDVELKTEETFDWTRWHDIYSQWLDYVRTFFSGPIMLIVPPRSFAGFGHITGSRRFHAFLHSVAVQYDVAFAEGVTEGIESRDNSCDGIHYKPEFNKNIAENVARKLVESGILKGVLARA